VCILLNFRMGAKIFSDKMSQLIYIKKLFLFLFHTSLEFGLEGNKHSPIIANEPSHKKISIWCSNFCETPSSTSLYQVFSWGVTVNRWILLLRSHLWGNWNKVITDKVDLNLLVTRVVICWHLYWMSGTKIKPGKSEISSLFGFQNISHYIVCGTPRIRICEFYHCIYVWSTIKIRF